MADVSSVTPSPRAPASFTDTYPGGVDSSQADEPVELRVGEVELLEQVAAGEVHRTRLAGPPERV